MLQRIKLFTPIAALALVMSLSACDGSVRREGPPAVDLQVVRVDAARNRLWVLDPTGLTLYDNLNGRRLRHIVLPELFLAGAEHICPPDVAFDAAGTVFVSSDVLPVLWRVDPQRFEVTRIELSLDADADKDVGFTGLSFAGDGIAIAAGATFASLWRIDLHAARASKVASYPGSSRACDPGALLRTAGGY
jgi:hypothetical protein